MARGRITPTFQLLTVKGKAMKPALMAGFATLERPDGEFCSSQVTDNNMGIVVCLERHKRVLADKRWSITSELDPYDNDVYKYRTVFAFGESASETEIIREVDTLLKSAVINDCIPVEQAY